MKPLRFAVIGAGFWANYQIPAWLELEGVELVALYNRTIARAEETAKKFNVSRVYDDIDRLFDTEHIDFVDIITDAASHAAFTTKAAERKISVVCQKPMAESLAEAKKMLDVCRQHETLFFIHENFRWQAPIRALKEKLDAGVIGRAVKARVSFCSAFPVFENQPFLKQLDHFILADIGSHVLDICRFLFGEVSSLWCLTQRVNPSIRGEDVANVLMKMSTGLHCYAEMSYASILEKEAFPQTLILVEGERGSLQLTNDFELKITTREGTTSSVINPKQYPWLDPAYAVVHSSIVDCNRDILNGMRGGKSETTGDDNFETVKLVWACYESAASQKPVWL